MGLVEKLPDISDIDIEDQSKSDIFAKAFATTQLLWFCIQLIGRAVEHIAITQLEIAVVAFATCPSLSYLLLLEKPKDIMNSRYFVATRYPMPEEMHLITSSGCFLYGPRRRARCIPDNSLRRIADKADQVIVFGVTSTLSASLFGTLHLLAWNFYFPSMVELWLWRLVSLCITILPPIAVRLNILLLQAFMAPRRVKVLGLAIGVNGLLMGSCAVVFTACWVFIFVETFRTLVYLDPSACSTTWSVNMLQIS
ncbi:hypothetical protein B0O99DRAFT_602299 [Bisporella sp. PMI_857]|nr:hypothetical protein B0O99DRAFT_602299 [Bisporella sp. PMI_857]